MRIKIGDAHYFLPFIAAVVLFLTLLLSSCMTKKKLDRICQLCPVKTIIKDSVHVEYKERIDTAYITKTVTITQENPCKWLCDSVGNLKKVDKTFKTKSGSTRMFTRNDSLLFEVKLDSLEAVIKAKDQIINRFRDKVVEVPARCELDHRTKWDGFTHWVTIITFCILILLALYFLAKKYLP